MAKRRRARMFRVVVVAGTALTACGGGVEDQQQPNGNLPPGVYNPPGQQRLDSGADADAGNDVATDTSVDDASNDVRDEMPIIK